MSPARRAAGGDTRDWPQAGPGPPGGPGCGRGPLELSRKQVVAHRVAVSGLIDRVAGLPDLVARPLSGLGVQDTPPGALRVALSARLAEPLGPDDGVTAGGVLTLVWPQRGTPHLHRTAALQALAAAGWPRGDADAAARLGWQRKRLADAGMAYRTAYRTVAEAVGAARRPAWRGDLVPVRVEGRAAEVPAEQVATLREAEPAPVVRLLPPSDPLLQGRDREVLLPDPAHRSALWTALGAPGAVLRGADAVGLWRTRQRGGGWSSPSRPSGP